MFVGITIQHCVPFLNDGVVRLICGWIVNVQENKFSDAVVVAVVAVIVAITVVVDCVLNGLNKVDIRSKEGGNGDRLMGNVFLICQKFH